MRNIALALSLLIAGCNPSPPADVDQDAEKALADLEAAQAELEKVKAEAAETAKRAVARQEMANAQPPTPDLCWQDYCPCDNPETALDRTICRNARGGVEMSDDQWAIGAQARDMKREGDRLNAEMDDILADAQSQRREIYEGEY